jgi:C_GCAxxG_C_C family probable redox protein
MNEKKDEIVQMAFDRAKQYEMRNGGCAQCTVAGIFEALGVEDEGVLKAATGLADGVGLTGDGHCGALSGGAMAISYFFGRSQEDFPDMMKQLHACILSKKLHDRFVEQYGTCRCTNIQECSTLVGKTARMATEIILDERERLARKAAQP